MPRTKNPQPEPKQTDAVTNLPAKPKTPVVPGTDGLKDEKVDEGQTDDYDTTLKPNYPESPAHTATKTKQR